MLKNEIFKIKDWLSSFFHQPIKKHFASDSQSGYVRIPIQMEKENKFEIPIHFLSSKETGKIPYPILNALGGINNIESYREIPNSKRIRLTLINPKLIDNDLLEQIEIRLFIRIGKRIVHIIP